jgi:hypothetical protein
MGTQWEYLENRKKSKKICPHPRNPKEKETVSGCKRMNGG